MESRNVKVVLVGNDYTHFVNALNKTKKWGSPIITIGIDFFNETIDNTTYQIWDNYRSLSRFSPALLKDSLFKNTDAVIFFDATDELKNKVKENVSPDCVFIDYDVNQMTTKNCLKKINTLISQKVEQKPVIQKEKDLVTQVPLTQTQTQTPFNLYSVPNDLPKKSEAMQELEKMFEPEDAPEPQSDNKGFCPVM